MCVLCALWRRAEAIFVQQMYASEDAAAFSHDQFAYREALFAAHAVDGVAFHEGVVRPDSVCRFRRDCCDGCTIVHRKAGVAELTAEGVAPDGCPAAQ